MTTSSVLRALLLATLWPLCATAQASGAAAQEAAATQAGTTMPTAAAGAAADAQAFDPETLPRPEDLPPGFELPKPGSKRPPDYKPRVTDPESVARGKSLFGALGCQFCHGPDIRGGSGGPSLLRSQKVLQDQKGETLYDTITKGVPNTAMVGFDLTPAQVADIAEFLHSFPVGGRDKARDLPTSIVTGNAVAGRNYFEKHCIECHSASGDLHDVAVRYPKPRTLQQRWLLSRDAPRPTVRVHAGDGSVAEGTLVRIDEFLVSLKRADGVQQSYRLGDRATRVEVNDPLSWHKQQLPRYSDAEIHDVTAYLVTLK
jgi:cytochrome c oxidase cbb3-type subunit 3